MNPNLEGERLPAIEPASGPAVDVRTADGHSISSVLARHLSDLSDEAMTLMRGEIALAKAEIDEKIHVAQRGLIETLAGGAVLFSGFLVLLASAVFGLANVMPLWAAALIVGLAVAIIGAVAVGKGKHDISVQGLKPERMIEEGRRTKHFAQEQLP